MLVQPVWSSVLYYGSVVINVRKPHFNEICEDRVLKRSAITKTSFKLWEFHFYFYFILFFSYNSICTYVYTQKRTVARKNNILSEKAQHDGVTTIMFKQWVCLQKEWKKGIDIALILLTLPLYIFHIFFLFDNLSAADLFSTFSL